MSAEELRHYSRWAVNAAAAGAATQLPADTLGWLVFAQAILNTVISLLRRQ